MVNISRESVNSWNKMDLFNRQNEHSTTVPIFWAASFYSFSASFFLEILCLQEVYFPLAGRTFWSLGVGGIFVLLRGKIFQNFGEREGEGGGGGRGLTGSINLENLSTKAVISFFLKTFQFICRLIITVRLLAKPKESFQQIMK